MNIQKLYPVCKDYLWGGSKLKTDYEQTELTPCEESWELSFHPDGMSRLGDGRTPAELLARRSLARTRRSVP